MEQTILKDILETVRDTRDIAISTKSAVVSVKDNVDSLNERVDRLEKRSIPPVSERRQPLNLKLLTGIIVAVGIAIASVVKVIIQGVGE